MFYQVCFAKTGFFKSILFFAIFLCKLVFYTTQRGKKIVRFHVSVVVAWRDKSAQRKHFSCVKIEYFNHFLFNASPLVQDVGRRTNKSLKAYYVQSVYIFPSGHLMPDRRPRFGSKTRITVH